MLGEKDDKLVISSSEIINIEVKFIDQKTVVHSGKETLAFCDTDCFHYWIDDRLISSNN